MSHSDKEAHENNGKMDDDALKRSALDKVILEKHPFILSGGFNHTKNS